MARAARVVLSKKQMETLRTEGSITVNIPPDVDTLRIEVEKRSEAEKRLDDLLNKMTGIF